MQFSPRGFSRSLKIAQRLPHMIGLRVDGTGTASITEGGHEATLVDNGTGDWTLTFSKPFARVPVVVCTPVTSNTYLDITPLAASVQIKAFSVSAQTAKDALFHVLVLGFDAADVI